MVGNIKAKLFTIIGLLTTLAVTQAHQQNQNLSPNGTKLRINAIVAKNGFSAFECWDIDPELSISQQKGTVGAKIGSLGNSEGASVVFFSPNSTTDAGFHNAPSPQWVMMLSGSGTIHLANSQQVMHLRQGDILAAVDTSNISKQGHDSVWSKGSTVLQLPFANGTIPTYEIVNEGPCK